MEDWRGDERRILSDVLSSAYRPLAIHCTASEFVSMEWRGGEEEDEKGSVMVIETSFSRCRCSME